MPRIDKGLAIALVLGAVVRLVPLAVWAQRPCVRDECAYRSLAGSLLRGDGMEGPLGWLWAPGYPAMIALHARLFGRMSSVAFTQVAVALLTVFLLWRFTRRHFGLRAAGIAAFLLALNPTHVFYAASVWSECFYTALLFGLITAVGWARGEPPGETDGSELPRWRRGLAVGVLLGACVLMRGVATYLLPCVALTLLWRRAHLGAAWRSVAVVVLATVLVVAPYSAYASHKFGALVISDRTLGQTMWLGDNDFPPVTFDVGSRLFTAADAEGLAGGRAHCPFAADPVRQDTCETAHGLAWIEAHPAEFLGRIPLRLAQMFTPHSLLTRELRTGELPGVPRWGQELIVVTVALASYAVVLGGAIGAFAFGRGWFAVGSALIVGYHVAAVACLFGLSRFRVPLEPFAMVYAAGFFANPRAGLAALRADRRRFWGAISLGGTLLLLMLWFLPAGWRGWHTW